jgi:PAS domain-containing protein
MNYRGVAYLLWQRTAMMIAILIASIITGVLAFFAYQHRHQTGAREFAALMITLSIYSFGYGFELSSNNLAQVLFWNKFEYIGIAFIPFFWIMLIGNYIGISQTVKKWIIYILLVASLFTLGANFTNGFHHLYYINVSIRRENPFSIITYQMGPLGFAYLIYLYSMVFGGNVLLITALTRTAKIYRSQICMVICGSLITWLGSIIYVFDGTPYRLDPCPFAFTLTGLVLTWGVFRHKLLNLSPIARGIIFGTMRDGVLIVDMQDRIVDYNPAARNLFKELTPGVIGRNLAEVIPDHKQLIDQVRNNLARSEFYVIGKDRRCIDSQLSLILSNSKTPIGKNIICDDITLQREAQTQFIQAEKLTVLGQLVSNVVHEMNTPLAAIKATAENIEQTFINLGRQLVNALDGLGTSQKQLCLEILEKSQTGPESTPMEVHEALEKLLPVLEKNKLAGAEDIVYSFALLNIAEYFIRLVPVIQDEQGRVYLRFILEIAKQRKKIAGLLFEEERAASIVRALKSYSHPSA